MANLDKIESAIRKAGGSFKLFFVTHRAGWKFALTSEKLSNAEYQALAARFASTPVDAVAGGEVRKNNLRWRVEHG